MKQTRLAIILGACAGALSFIGWRLCFLFLTYTFGGPAEPPSGMSFEEFHIRSASMQWVRDETDSFITATVFCVAAFFVLVLVGLWIAQDRKVASGTNGSRYSRGAIWWSAGTLFAGVWIVVSILVYWRLGGQAGYGGNTAALAACRVAVTSLELISYERNHEPVSIADLKPAERERFEHHPGLKLLEGATIWINPFPIADKGPRSKGLMAVCDRAFDNVPRRLFGKALPTHAVAFADGSTDLVCEEDFKRLDLHGFVDLRKIRDQKEEPDGAANRSQPIRPETNRTSAAAGSGR
ncbi:MAG TPA: hypothetical protein VN673_05610 [Clostridia bacterium]|nr:hypothetical protein [Clostridia bacterium]